MKRIVEPALLLVSAGMIVGCLGAGRPPDRPAPPAVAAAASRRAAPSQPAAAIDLARAERFMRELDAACQADGGRLWGRSLAGPMLFVDEESRYVVANRSDPGGRLQRRGELFVGVLPEGVAIANTRVDWQGLRWTMVMWGAIGDARDAPRRKLIAHEAFHRLQSQLGLEVPNELNSHLDTKDARLLMQLEWNALEVALGAQGLARARALGDALAFRRARQEKFPQAQTRESALEVNEGLAEYTGARLAGYSVEELVQSGRRRRAHESGFVRSFAYVSGPLYGYLLDDASADWRRKVTSKTDLGALLAEVAKVPASTESIAAAGARYGGAALTAAEELRARERDAQIAEWRKQLIAGPVLIMPLEEGDGVFDPRRVFPLSESETVYVSRQLEGSWGSLTAEEAPLLEDKVKNRATVSLEGAAPDGMRGKSWVLKLAPGWTLSQGERQGDLIVVRSISYRRK